MPTRRELANAIRVLSMDSVQRANSGHPGMPMGMADIAEVLWNDFLRFNPCNPNWSNRDRFVLSNGHGSMLLYSLLHLTGYEVTIEDLKNFRQLNSITPGHPEVGDTPGVETTTGPLGQGLGNAVGMAIAEKVLAAQFNREAFNIVDHHTYVFLGDGCLMEGLSHEVCSFAGVMGLGKLIAIWDDNGISIDGEVKSWFRDDTPKRFEAYGWHVISNVDGHDAKAIHDAIQQAKLIEDKPTLICCRTIIGFGSPGKAGKETSHGSPLGEEEIAKAREQLNWYLPPFEIPKEYYGVYDAKERGDRIEKEWQIKFEKYRKNYPELAAEFQRRLHKQLPDNWEQIKESMIEKALDQNDKLATRKASQKILEALGPILPELMGGSADLTESNLTNWSGSRALSHEQSDANYIHYGVREFGMSVIMNGMSLYGGFIPYGGTFLVFESYAASAVRMSALMKQRVIYVYTHDSIGLGEDGPTHQPIEQIVALRATPNTSVWRPCDLVETAIAWQMALENKTGPTALLLSRQGLPAQTRDRKALMNINKGGYVLVDCADKPEAIVIATGSEVTIAVEAATQLNNNGKKIRVVSMPSIDVFLKQDRSYQESVLPRNIKKRVAIEAACGLSWHKFIGDEGKIISMERFGKSAPIKDLFTEFGFTVEHLVEVLMS